MEKNSLSTKYKGITINNYSLPIREYNGNRVVTLKDVDTVHGRPTGTARRNFNMNRKHLIEGTDYFVRKTDEARQEFGITAPNGLILLTESGYLMLVKSFTDDLAWEVQRELINGYFRKSVQNEWDQASPDLKFAYSLLKSQLDLQLQTQEIAHNLDTTNRRIDRISDIIKIDPIGWRYDCRKILYSIANKRGGFQHVGEVYTEVYSVLEHRAGVNLKVRLKHRLERLGATQAEHKNLSRQDIIAADKKLIQIYIAIVKEMAIKEGINFDYSEKV